MITRQLLIHEMFLTDLFVLLETYDMAISEGYPASARAIKDDMLNRLERWIEDRNGRLATEDAFREQITAAQRSIGETTGKREMGIPF